MHGKTRYYSFQHLTFQEFLAAYYASELTEEEQHRLFDKYGANPEMREVWKFFFGIMKNKPSVSLAALFLEIAKHNTRAGIDTLFLCRCIFETQSHTSYDTNSKSLCEELLLSRNKVSKLN